MPSTPASSKPVTLVLDAPRILVYDTRAEYRMGSLERPFVVQDFRIKKRAWAALVAWVWACLSEKDERHFPTPESVAPFLKTQSAVDDAMKAFFETWDAGQEPEEDSPKGKGSTSGPSHASA
jgi:hypothetical protein